MRPRKQHMLATNVEGVPAWVARGASSSGDPYGTAPRHNKDSKSASVNGGGVSGALLRLPPIARDPNRAVAEFLDAQKTKSSTAKLNRKMKGIVDAMPLEEASLLPLVGGNRKDPVLEDYAAAAAEAAARTQAQRHKALQEKERRARLQRSSSGNRAVWRDIAQGERTRVELTARSLHRAQFQEEEKKQQLLASSGSGLGGGMASSGSGSGFGVSPQQSYHAPADDHTAGQPHDHAAVSPYSRAIRAPLVSFAVSPPVNNISLRSKSPTSPKPAFIIDGEEREQQEEAERQRRLDAAREKHEEDIKEASLTSLPAMSLGDDGRAGSDDSPGSVQLPMKIKKSGNDNDDDDDDDRYPDCGVSQLTLTYLHMLEKNESFQRRNLERSFVDGLVKGPFAQHRDRLMATVRGLLRERRALEVLEAHVRATTVVAEQEAQSAQMLRQMEQDRSFAAYHEKQRPACLMLRCGHKINIDRQHSTTYVVEWRHRNTNPLDLIAVLLDEKNQVIATASRDNTVRSREGITCVRPFSNASPSLVRLGPVTHRSCLQISLVTLPPQTRTILFSVVVPWHTLHLRDNYLLAQASPRSRSVAINNAGSNHSSSTNNNSAAHNQSSHSNTVLSPAASNSISSKPTSAAPPSVPGSAARKKSTAVSGSSFVASCNAAAAAALQASAPTAEESQLLALLQMSDAKKASLFQGFESIGTGWLTVFDASPLVQTVGAHLAPHEVPRLDEVTTIELVTTGNRAHLLEHCVAVTLGGFHLNHRSRTPAVFHSMDRRYVGGKKVVEELSALCALRNDAAFNFDSAVQCLVQEMNRARMALLWPLLALHEAFERQRIVITERKGEPKRLALDDHINSSSSSNNNSNHDASSASAGPADNNNSNKDNKDKDEMRRKSQGGLLLNSGAASGTDRRSRPQTPTVGFVGEHCSTAAPSLLFAPRRREDVGREELFEEFCRGVHTIEHRVAQDALTKTASSIL